MADRTQAGVAYNDLKHRILILELAPKYRIKEEEWAERLQVSRAAIRECLKRLQGEGLVTAREQGGFFVSETTPEEMGHIRELRGILEAAAITLACQRATESQLREIDDICDDHARMVQQGNMSGALEADRSFHQSLLVASGNARLQRAYQISNIPLFHMTHGRGNLTKADLLKTQKQHRAIAAALRERNSTKAIKLLKTHLSRYERDASDNGST